MKILFAGRYDPRYNRTAVIKAGLKKLNCDFTEFPFTEKNNSTKNKIAALAEAADIIFLPSFTHADVAFVKKITKKPLIFDPLISKYLTKVYDYRQVHKFSIRAVKNFFKDKKAFSQADHLFADTEAHKKYFCKTFKVAPEKISALPVGVNTDEFFPGKAEKIHSQYKVGFYGGFNPLQGTQKIVEAAYLLKEERDIVFELIGDGFEFDKTVKRAGELKLENISFTGRIAHAELPSKINSFDLCLGIFGDTPKAELVIPNKIFHYAACQKPIITKETPAIKEIFASGKNILLSSGTPEAIAEEILKLKNDREKSADIAKETHSIISKSYNETAIAAIFLRAADRLFRQQR